MLSGMAPAQTDTAAPAETITRLRLTVTRLSRRLRQQADVGELTPSRVSALSTVERYGPLTLTELAAAEQVQPPSMTRIVASLEDAGLVLRETDPSDRRSARVRITAAGSRVLNASRTKKNLYLARRLKSFTP